jgi:hypothetical protein
MSNYDPATNSRAPASNGSISSRAPVYRPNIVGAPLLPSGQRGPTQYFNKANVLAAGAARSEIDS